jgi:hypothetical protein
MYRTPVPTSGWIHFLSYDAINKATSGGLGGKPGFLSSQADMNTLVTNYLANMATGNFYFRGHGNKNGGGQIGNNIDSGPGIVGYDWINMGLKLGNGVSYAGGSPDYNNFIHRNHPYLAQA